MTAPRWSGPPPLAFVVDLDDTLYPQAHYLAGAAKAVAAAAGRLGLDAPSVEQALTAEFAAGSDRPGTIDRALFAVGVASAELTRLVPPLVDAFTRYTPDRLSCYPGVEEALVRLARTAPVACLTDGNPRIQEVKLAATGLRRLFDAVVVTDRVAGRSGRKPHPAGLFAVAERLGVAAERMLVIGDRPSKDVAVAVAVGARAIRIRQGEHAAAPDVPLAWAVTDSFPAAAAIARAAARC